MPSETPLNMEGKSIAIFVDRVVASDPLDLWEGMEVQDMDTAAQAMVLHMGKVHPRLRGMVQLLDMVHLLGNPKLPSMVNNHLKLPSMVTTLSSCLWSTTRPTWRWSAAATSPSSGETMLLYPFFFISLFHLQAQQAGQGMQGGQASGQ